MRRQAMVLRITLDKVANNAVNFSKDLKVWVDGVPICLCRFLIWTCEKDKSLARFLQKVQKLGRKTTFESLSVVRSSSSSETTTPVALVSVIKAMEWICTGFNQCCGSGSGIRCLFDPWIRDG